MTGMEISLLCLALNVYYEARNEPIEAQIAVAQVTIARSRIKKRPVCEEVYSPFQFSWTNGHVLPPQPGEKSWIQAQHVARLSYQKSDQTGGALWYHRYDITPWWVWNKQRIKRLGAHIFYKCKKGYRCGWP